MLVLVSAAAMKAIIRDEDGVRDWFKAAQNRDFDPAVARMTVTGFVMVRTGVEGCRDKHERAAFDFLNLLLRDGLEVVPISLGIAIRFGRMVRRLTGSGVTGYTTLEILDAAAARESGCALLAPPTPHFEKLEAGENLVLCGPWHGI